MCVCWNGLYSVKLWDVQQKPGGHLSSGGCTFHSHSSRATLLSHRLSGPCPTIVSCRFHHHGQGEISGAQHWVRSWLWLTPAHSAFCLRLQACGCDDLEDHAACPV